MSNNDKSKEKRLRLIRQCMAFGISTEESLDHLKQNGITINERTYRRDKAELKQQYGRFVRNIFEKEIASDMFKDFFTFQEIHNECWDMIRDKKTSIKDKIRLFECITKTITEKLNLHGKLPPNVRQGIIERNNEESSFELNFYEPMTPPDYENELLVTKLKHPDWFEEEDDRKTDKCFQELN